MKLVITIDTEEDNWGEYSSGGHRLENIGRIPRLQEVFDAYRARPTYLVTYPVATDEKSIALLGEISRTGRCEIGMHCHPWNTPPFEEELNEKNSMLCNLPRDLQFRKLYVLHRTIRQNFGVNPVSFRSGRWGYDKGVEENLCALGYQVDSSITPYIDWTDEYGPDFSEVPPQPFRSRPGDSSCSGLLEVPATIGYLQQNFTQCNAVHKLLSTRPINRLRLVGILYRLNLLNKVWLSPEQSDSGQMIALAARMIKQKSAIINLFFHSTALKAGLTEYVRTGADEERFLQQIASFLEFTSNAGIESVTLSQAATLVD